jgi:uncharacterized cupin superfamily protein
MGESKPLTPERARELSDRLEAARKESEAIRAHLEEYRQRARMFWPERRRVMSGLWECSPGEDSKDATE